MKLFNACVAIALAALATITSADPIHPQADGAYWHHDSGWIFPEKIADFVRVGIPQDVAGSRDAVAYYAHEIDGARVVVSVDVFPVDSAADATTLATAKASLAREARVAAADLVETTRELTAGGLHATQVSVRKTEPAALFTFYFVDSGQWRVRIQTASPRATDAVAPAIDAFVRGQRWDTLPR